jgi:hypothetical protein
LDYGQGLRFTNTLKTGEMTDSIVEAVITKIRNRAEVGLKKYGKTMDRDDLTLSEWIIHAQEEIMDLLLYLEKINHDDTRKICNCHVAGKPKKVPRDW